MLHFFVKIDIFVVLQKLCKLPIILSYYLVCVTLKLMDVTPSRVLNPNFALDIRFLEFSLSRFRYMVPI